MFSVVSFVSVGGIRHAWGLDIVCSASLHLISLKNSLSLKNGQKMDWSRGDTFWVKRSVFVLLVFGFEFLQVANLAWVKFGFPKT